MTDKQRVVMGLQRKLSAARTKLAVIDPVVEVDRTEAQRTEYRSINEAMPALETEFRAACEAAEGEQVEQVVETRGGDTPEGREYRALIGRANLGVSMRAALEHRQADGAEGELATHLGLDANMVPLDLLRDQRSEMRGTTSAPTHVQTDQAPIEQPVFALGSTAWLGIPTPTVASGDAVFPVLSNRPVVRGPFTGDDDAVESDGVWTADLLPPSRLQASYITKRTDIARMPGIADALKLALSSGLSEKVDAQMVAQIVTDTTRIDQTTNDTYASYVANLLYSRIDGRYAMSESDIRLLMGTDTYTDMAATYRATESAETALTHVKAAGAMVRVSPHVAAAPANNRADVIVRRGLRDDAVVPLWQGVEIIEDPYGVNLGKGEVEITAVLLAAFKVTRPAAFIRQQTDHS